MLGYENSSNADKLINLTMNCIKTRKI